MSRYEDTIAAISTAASAAGIAVIRVSGPDAVNAVEQIFVSPAGKKLTEQAANTIHYGWIRQPQNSSGEQEQTDLVDEVLIMLMKAPHTFTREDVVEIDCHGGVFAARKVRAKLLASTPRFFLPPCCSCTCSQRRQARVTIPSATTRRSFKLSAWVGRKVICLMSTCSKTKAR